MRLLFAISKLACGGAEKSLLSLLDQLDPARYQVDLYLLEPGGDWLAQLPPAVRVLPRDDLVSVWNAPLSRSLRIWRERRQWLPAARRLLYSFRFKGAFSDTRRSRVYWKYLRPLLTPPPESYDVAIAYLEGATSYFVWQLVRARRKFAYVHGDYNHLASRCLALDRPCFQAMDKVIAVSRTARDILQDTFPDLRDKFVVVENLVLPSRLRQLAAAAPNPFSAGFTGLRILTVGRLTPPKGIDIALEACRLLVAGGADIRWHVLGDGPERPRLSRAIARARLEDRFVLEGECANPYPYFKHCDLYVQPSRHEGWGIAIEEAKIFARPVVVTRFASAPERIEQDRTGRIVDLSPAALAAGIRDLIAHPDRRRALEQNLAGMSFGNAGERQQFLALLEHAPSAPACP